MKSAKNILIAFILNLSFSLMEFVGALLTGSVAIASDAVHDLADALSIGLAFFLEKKSSRPPDETYTYGYGRFSALGGLITSGILLCGSVGVIAGGIHRLFNPVPIHYDGMILLALIGVAVNVTAAWFTRQGESLNQKAVNLHMLEDVLGWLAVLAGAVVMRFTDFWFIDPILSIGIALYILIHATGHLRESTWVFLEKTPREISPRDVEKALTSLPEVEDVHHIHLWSLDGVHHCATLHIVSGDHSSQMRHKIRHALAHLGVGHVTLEMELPGEDCGERKCAIAPAHPDHHHHHHHHSH